MKILFAVAPKKYRDDELLESIKVFEGEGIKWGVASTVKGRCFGIYGGAVDAKRDFHNLSLVEKFDGLIIIGGPGAQEFLWKDSDLHDLIRVFNLEKKPIGAISLAPVALAAAGILEGKKAAVHPLRIAIHEMMKGDAIVAEEQVVRTGWIVTASDSSVTKEFVQKFIDVLNGKPEWEKAESKLGFDF